MQTTLGRLPRILVAAAIALTAAVTQTAGRQQPPSQQPPPPQLEPGRPQTFRTEANFVRVDAYPTAGDRAVLDLLQPDFDVFEDGKLQKIETFEHVVARPAGPQESRAEPNTIEASRQLAANPRNRVFVLFLDVRHVTIEGSWNIREPLVRLIDRILGPDDLVGVMTPYMAASDLVLARKTTVLAAGLRDRWPWGERHTLRKDERETLYESCYPPMKQDLDAGRTTSLVAQEMIARRRERMALDALTELVTYLRGIREERKAIVTVTEGWLLYRENQSLTTLRTDAGSGAQERPPGPGGVGVGPDGRITMNDQRNGYSGSKSDCDADRLRFALMDDRQYFLDLVDHANRANASFYTVDPRGLAVWDSPMGPEPPPPPAADMAFLRERLSALRNLASGTDGLAVAGSNDLDAGLKRISDDLTSYYLLGYYSPAATDGKYHEIKVTVKRPGVSVRARRGYRAASRAEVAVARAAAAAPVPEGRSAVSAAMATLARVRTDTRFYVYAVPAWSSADGVSTVWVAGELQPVVGPDPWASGGTADVVVNVPGSAGTARVRLAPGQKAFLVPVALSQTVKGGLLDVQVRLAGADPGAIGLTASARVDAAAGPPLPLVFRRGASTGNMYQPVATFIFSRTERARVDVPVAAEVKPGSARLLDRTGQPLAIPVTAGERAEEATGQRWLTAEVSLSALAPGDYAVEVSVVSASGEQKTITAIRVNR